MANRVLHQWLQKQKRHQRVLRLRSNLFFDFQTVAETSALDFQIAVEKSDFFTQWHLLRFGLVQTQTKQIAQSRHHAVSSFRVFMNESGNSVQRVKQKMRVKLQSQSIKPGLDQFPSQFRGLQLALPVALVIMPPKMAKDHQPIDDYVHYDRMNRRLLEQIGEREDLSRDRDRLLSGY